MKFSAQEEYGLRCLLQIARSGADASLTIPEIARMENLSTTHVAKLLMILRKEGFVTSTRGQTGGYALARPSHLVKVGDVMAALGGRLYDEKFCGRHTGQVDICTHAVDCSVRSLWQIIQEAVDRVVDPLTIADMLDERTTKPNVTLFETPRRKILVEKPCP